MGGISYKANVLNQKGAPAIFEDTAANRPAAGFTGRIFISTDTFVIQRDNGTTWDSLGGGGSITGSGATGQVTFWSSASAISGDNTFFWDNTNKRLGLGTVTPGVRLDVHGTNVLQQLNGTTTNSAFLDFQNAGTSRYRIGNNYNGGTQVFALSNQVTAKNNFVVLPTNKYLLNSDTFTQTDSFSDWEYHKIGTTAGAQLYLYTWGAGATRYSNIGFYQTNATAQNTYSQTIDADGIGLIAFNGSSNSGFIQSAAFSVVQQGASSTYAPSAIKILSASSTVFPSVSIILNGNQSNAAVNSRWNVNGATDNSLFSLNNNGNFYTGGLSPTILTVGTNTTMAATATGYYCTATLTLTLPSAASINNIYWVIAGLGATITVNRAGSDDILSLTGTSVTTVTILPNQRAMFYVGGGTRTFLISQA